MTRKMTKKWIAPKRRSNKCCRDVRRHVRFTSYRVLELIGMTQRTCRETDVPPHVPTHFMKTFKQALQIRRKAVVFDVVAFILFVGVWISSGFGLGAFVAGFMLFAKTLTIWIHRTRIVEDFALRETVSNEKSA